MTKELTQEQLKRLLHYDPESGLFTWLVDRGAARVGRPAGCIDGDGYMSLKLLKRIYKAHRLAWFYMTGRWPVDLVDHKDGNGKNNRWGNLREATRLQNNHNARIAKTNSSGVKGVCWRPDTRKWKAQLCMAGRKLTIGHFQTLEAAEAAVIRARAAAHGDFANNGQHKEQA